MLPISEWQTKQYASNVVHVSQQKGSLLQPICRMENMTGSIAKFFDKIGTTTALVRGGRNSDTPNVDVEHLRRRLSVASYNWATLVDNVEKMKQIHSPESEYLKAAVMAFGRRKDQIILNALEAAAYEGEEGVTVTQLPTANKIAAVKSSAFSTLNIETLKLAKFKFMKNEVDKSLPLNFICAPEDIRALLGELEIGSYDYNNVKALVNGEVSSFMGFNFIVTNLLSSGPQFSTDKFVLTTGEFGSGGSVATAPHRRCFAVAGDALILGYGEDVKTRISEESTKNYNVQAYVEMTIGAMRLEDEKVIQVYTL